MRGAVPHRGQCARALLLAAAAVALAAGGDRAASAGAVIARTPDITVSLVSRGAARTREGVIEGVVIDGEVAGQDAALDFGFHSIRLELDIDCRRQRDRLRRVETFAEPRLGGEPTARPASGEWASPSREAYLAQVIRAMCGQDPGQSHKSVVERSPASPPLEPDPYAAVGGGAPARGSSDPAPPPMSPPASDAPPAPSSSGGPVVQVAAAETAAGAQAVLDRLKRSKAVSLGDLAGKVETATVKGRPVYRATLSGFASLAAARAFCVAVRASGGRCFVR